MVPERTSLQICGPIPLPSAQSLPSTSLILQHETGLWILHIRTCATATGGGNTCTIKLTKRVCELTHNTVRALASEWTAVKRIFQGSSEEPTRKRAHRPMWQRNQENLLALLALPFPVSHLYLSFPLPEISLQINNVLQKHLHSSLCLRLQGWENRGSHREGRLNPQKTNSPNNMLGLELCAGQTTGTCGWWLLGTDHLWQTVRAKPLSHWGELGCAQGQREVSGWCNSCGALTVIICLC